MTRVPENIQLAPSGTDTLLDRPGEFHGLLERHLAVYAAVLDEDGRHALVYVGYWIGKPHFVGELRDRAA